VAATYYSLVESCKAAYWIEMMLADIVRSAKTIRSASLLEELDALCSALDSALALACPSVSQLRLYLARHGAHVRMGIKSGCRASMGAVLCLLAPSIGVRPHRLRRNATSFAAGHGTIFFVG
jgi:hypothetical protein